MNEKANSFNGVFEIDETYESNSWLRVKIRTFAFNRNRNGSDILNSSFSNFSKAHTTIGAVPIVAKYNEETDNLEGHNVALRKNKDDEYEMHHDTNALGFTSPTTSFYFEDVNEGTESSPDFKKYVVVEDVYLWKRFDATRKIIEWFANGISPRVSMEIGNVQGQFDKEGYFQINDFEFTGIAALGSDVEPCFPKAEIQMYTVNEFKSDLKKLMYELSHSENLQEGGNTKMEDVTLETTETEVVENVETTENVEQEFNQVDETAPVEVVEEFEKDEQLIKEDDKDAPDSTEDSTEQSEEESTKDIAINETEEEALRRRDSLAVGEDAVPKVEEDKEEAEQTDFEAKFNELSAEFTALQSQLDELASYKRQREESDVKAKFADKLSEEEFTQVFESMKDAEIQDVEDKLFALYGKKNFSITSTNTSTQVNKVTLALPKEEEATQSPYGGLFEKYNKQEN